MSGGGRSMINVGLGHLLITFRRGQIADPLKPVFLFLCSPNPRMESFAARRLRSFPDGPFVDTKDPQRRFETAYFFDDIWLGDLPFRRAKPVHEGVSKNIDHVLNHLNLLFDRWAKQGTRVRLLRMKVVLTDGPRSGTLARVAEVVIHAPPAVTKSKLWGRRPPPWSAECIAIPLPKRPTFFFLKTGALTSV